jgi:hypothetical protein
MLVPTFPGGNNVAVPVATHSYVAQTPKVNARVAPAQVSHTYVAQTPKVNARVQPAQVTHSYTALVPQVKVNVQPGPATHTYVAQAPQVRVRVQPAPATHTYTALVPAITIGGPTTVAVPVATHTYTANVPVVSVSTIAVAQQTPAGRHRPRQERYVARYKDKLYEFESYEKLIEFVNLAQENEFRKPRAKRTPVKISIPKGIRDEYDSQVPVSVRLPKIDMLPVKRALLYIRHIERIHQSERNSDEDDEECLMILLH